MYTLPVFATAWAAGELFPEMLFWKQVADGVSDRYEDSLSARRRWLSCSR